jgi:hypothetical protein
MKVRSESRAKSRLARERYAGYRAHARCFDRDRDREFRECDLLLELRSLRKYSAANGRLAVSPARASLSPRRSLVTIKGRKRRGKLRSIAQTARGFNHSRRPQASDSIGRGSATFSGIKLVIVTRRASGNETTIDTSGAIKRLPRQAIGNENSRQTSITQKRSANSVVDIESCRATGQLASALS